MDASELQNRITTLKNELASLPQGSITKKNIKGHTYFYYRYKENNQRKEKFIAHQELETLKTKIDLRKELEKELKNLTVKSITHLQEESFITNILKDEDLISFANPVKSYKKRECFFKVHDYIYGDFNDKVLILYGLRRTGKTTIIRQIISEMTHKDLSSSAFLQVTSKNTLADVNHDLKILKRQGIKYVFLDEVTLMDDFIEGSALFSDIFASCGMKIVLSGTDSLGFMFTEDEQLYDRCILIHTTFIPYREFENVLGIHDIDAYIRYGGTMSMSGLNYNEHSPFSDKKNADEYVDTAIARNIQHSLRCYQYGDHFRNLRDLYEKNELTNAVNRVVEDINHRFTLDVLTRNFKSHDLGISANNLRKDKNHPNDILDRVNVPLVTQNIKKLLEILNKEEQQVHINNTHALEIKEYLDLLDLTCDIDILFLPDVSKKSSRTLISQPGLRYAQAKALIYSLLLDERFSSLSFLERKSVEERILSEIRGRMLEDLVLLETKLANPKHQVFILQFPVGEFDMVCFDPNAGTCKIFEIKHSDKIVPMQFRHLIDKNKCQATEHRFGSILGKFVLYRGETKQVDNIQYLNVEEYLRCLGESSKQTA